MSKESREYQKEDKIEEEQMLDTLSWALNFMRNYEEKRERQKQFRITKQMFNH